MLLINNSFRSAGALGVFMVAASAAHAGSFAPQKAKAEMQEMNQARRLMADRGSRFVENKGQWNQEARFLAKGRGLNLWYTEKGIRYDQSSASAGKRQIVDMYFVGGKRNAPVGLLKAKAQQDIYRGDVSIRGISSYRELISENVLPGVAMRSYFEKGRPRYDLILAPGVDPALVKIGYRGANGLKVVDGSLKIGTKLGGIFNGKPVAFQNVGGKRIPVAARWTVSKAGVAGFRLGAYDARKPLVIDPLVYGSYFGGEQGPDEIRAAVSDVSPTGVDRGLIVVGSSASADYPATSFPFTDTLNPARVDAFIARIDPSGSKSDFSVLFGGLGDDVAQYLKVDPFSRDLWVAGTTIFNNTVNSFPATNVNPDPLTAPVRDTKGTIVAGATNVFVARFTHTSDGSISFGTDNSNADPRIATVFGLGTNSAALSGFDLLSLGDRRLQMVFTGNTSAQLPDEIIPNETGQAGVDNGHAFPGHRAGFIHRFFVSAGSVLPANTSHTFINTVNSQYIEGSRLSELHGVALDASARAYVFGTVFQSGSGNPNPLNVDTSVFPSFFKTVLGNSDNFDPNGSSILPQILRGTDTFVRIYELTNSGPQSLKYSALLGGNGTDEAGGTAFAGNGSIVYTGNAIAVDADGTIFVTGITSRGNNFPYTAGAVGGGFLPPSNGNADVQTDIFVSKISIQRDGGVASNSGISGSRLEFSGNLNTNSRQVNGLTGSPSQLSSAQPAGIAVNAQGYVYITGNLRPSTIVFPSVPASPNVPTSFTLPTIQTVSLGSTPVLDAVYASRPVPEYPTTEGFLTILQPAGNGIYYSTYLGGDLDEMVFGPGFDSSGNVIITGWSDGARAYSPPVTTPPAPFYPSFSTLPSSLLGGLGGNSPIKPNSDSILPPDGSPALTALTSSVFAVNGLAYTSTNTSPGQPYPNNAIGINVARDGIVLRINPDLPPVTPLVLGFAVGPSTIEPLDFTTATVTLNVKQSLNTRVKIAGANGTRISANSIGGTDPSALFDLGGLSYDPIGDYYYVTIPAGQTSVTFAIASAKYGNGVTGTFTASLVDGSQSLTQTLTVRPLNYTVVLTKADGTPVTTSGLSSTETPATITGTVTIIGGDGQPRTLPSGISLLISVPTSANGTVTVNNPNVTIPAGSSIGTFTLNVQPVTTPTSITITATVNAASSVDSNVTIARTTQIAVRPVSLLTVRATPNPIRSTSRTQLAVTVTFSGDPGDNPDVAFDFSLRGAFRRASGSSLVRVPGTTNQFTAYFVPNRVSRSVDVTITATRSGTSARTAVTLLR